MMIEELISTIPCREHQLQDLLDLLGARDESLPYSLFVSGSMATGKSLCLSTVLQYLNYKHVFIDCIECYSPKILYEAVVAGINDDEEVKCDSMWELTNFLNGICLQKFKYEPIVLVFDRAERLRTLDQNIMMALLRIREFCKLNICTIFISNQTYENFYFQMGVREPIQLYFPNYNKEELFKIIFLHQKSFVIYLLNDQDIGSELKEDLQKHELFANFLNAFLSVFYRACRDLIELQHMARLNFLKYCEPIIKSEIKSTDLTKLWRHIAPLLKTSLELLYLRMNTSKTVQLLGTEHSATVAQATSNYENTLKEELLSTKTFAQSFELPYYTKYLLIAAYLASYNPPKEDKRLFMKNHGKQKKKSQQVRAKAKISEKLNTQLGPKVFTLDRLLAIFYAVLEDKIGLTSNLLAQIATLVELKLLAGSKEIDLDASKYKCIVGYDFITAVAQTVRFNVRKYLYDFI